MRPDGVAIGIAASRRVALPSRPNGETSAGQFPVSIAVIINPVAGGASQTEARRRAQLASEVVASLGEDAEVFVTLRRGHARELAAAAVTRGARIVLAWGGDGTVNEVASALMRHGTPLGIVPSGSGNGLARALGIPARPEQAIAEALTARPRQIDAGELGERAFFSVAGIGFDAHVAACFDRDTGHRGLSTYARIVSRELLRYRGRAYRVDQNGHRLDVRALLIVLANAGQFGNGARIAPGARVDDGRLDLVVVEERSRLAMLVALPRLFTGGIERVRGVSIRRVEHAVVECDSPMTFHVDGEPLQGGTRLEARVLPAALRVCVN
jgi:YegS/Rv2252/BmrU family lipid kinase